VSGRGVLMNVRERVKIAENIAKELVEVTRNEWLRWVQVTQGDLDKGIRWAERLSNDITLRPTPRYAAKQIARVLRRYQYRLNNLPHHEREEIFGYVARFLSIRTLRGSSSL